MKTNALLLTIAALLAGCGQPRSGSGDEPFAQAALVEHRELFHHILGDDEQLQPGPGLAVSTVRLDELAAFAGGAVEPLLHDGGERLVPLSGKAGVRTGMTLVRDGDGWTMSRAGAASLTRAVVAARGAASGDEVGLVRIAGLAVDFLATRSDGELRLTALFDEPGAGVTAGHAEPARALFTRLQPLASSRSPADHTAQSQSSQPIPYPSRFLDSMRWDV
jgi:hypothetical protein